MFLSYHSSQVLLQSIASRLRLMHTETYAHLWPPTRNRIAAQDAHSGHAAYVLSDSNRLLRVAHCVSRHVFNLDLQYLPNQLLSRG